MDILQNLESILGKSMGGSLGPNGGQTASGAGGLGALSSFLTPEVLGGIAGALFPNKGGASNAAGGAGGLGQLLGSLFSGGSDGLFGQHQNSMQAAHSGAVAPRYDSPAPAPRDQAMRFIRTLVFAAKADGHIDDNEQAAIRDQIRKLGIGSEGESMIKQAMDEPLDPNLIANGVVDSREALQLFALSCAVINIDHFMEKSYLDALANALQIPADVKASVETKIRG